MTRTSCGKTTFVRRSALIALGGFFLTMLGNPGNALAQNKAAFLFPGSINDQSWNAQGYRARKSSSRWVGTSRTQRMYRPPTWWRDCATMPDAILIS